MRSRSATIWADAPAGTAFAIRVAMACSTSPCNVRGLRPATPLDRASRSRSSASPVTMSRKHSERTFVNRPRSQAPMSVVPPPPASRSPLGEGSGVIVSATDRLSIVIELARLIQAVDAGADPGLRAMLARVSGFLPVGSSPKVAVDSAHRAEAEEQLIGEVAQDEDKRLAPAPCAMVCLLELAQAANLDEDAEGEAREWQECKQRK